MPWRGKDEMYAYEGLALNEKGHLSSKRRTSAMFSTERRKAYSRSYSCGVVLCGGWVLPCGFCFPVD